MRPAFDVAVALVLDLDPVLDLDLLRVVGCYRMSDLVQNMTR